MKKKTLEQRSYVAAERRFGPNDSKKVTVPRYVLKDWFRHGWMFGFIAASRQNSPATTRRLKKIAADRLIGMCKAADERDALRKLLQHMLDVAENADETGYVTDAGFVDLDALHAEVRAALTP